MCKKFKTSLGFLGLFLIVALTGCGGSGSGSGSGSSEISSAGAVSIAPGSIDLGEAGKFALLAHTGVDTTPDSSNVNGNIGVYPYARGFLTGWSQTAAPDASDVYSTSAQVAAPFKLYAADYAEPTPTNLLAAVSDMELAYENAAGRLIIDETKHNIDATTLGAVTLGAGVYKWDGALGITTDVTLDGSATDVWIIQVVGALTMGADLSINLTSGALPENVFWQVASGVTVDARSHFEGVVLSKTAITFGNLASIDGRLLAQTAIVIDATTVTVP